MAVLLGQPLALGVVLGSSPLKVPEQDGGEAKWDREEVLLAPQPCLAGARPGPSPTEEEKKLRKNNLRLVCVSDLQRSDLSNAAHLVVCFCSIQCSTKESQPPR